MWDEVFSLCWDGDRGRPGGRIIPYCGREDVYGWRGGERVGCPLGRTSDGIMRGRGRFKSNTHNNKRRSLGMQWSVSENVTPPPHDLDTSHGLVSSNTHTHITPPKRTTVDTSKLQPGELIHG